MTIVGHGSIQNLLFLYISLVPTQVMTKIIDHPQVIGSTSLHDPKSILYPCGIKNIYVKTQCEKKKLWKGKLKSENKFKKITMNNTKWNKTKTSWSNPDQIMNYCFIDDLSHPNSPPDIISHVACQINWLKSRTSCPWRQKLALSWTALQEMVFPVHQSYHLICTSFVIAQC